MKITNLKVFNSVKIGTGEYIFLQDKDFDMNLIDNLVYIVHKKEGVETITPLTNVPWLTRAKTEPDAHEKNDKSKSNENSPSIKRKKK